MRTSYPTTPNPKQTHPSKVRPNPTHHNWTIWQPAQHVNVPGVQRNEIPRSHLTSTAVMVKRGNGWSGGCQGADEGLGVCSFRTCSIQNGRFAVHSRTEFQSISSGTERVGGIQLALLQKLILHSSLSAAVCVAFPFFRLALPCLPPLLLFLFDFIAVAVAVAFVFTI